MVRARGLGRKEVGKGVREKGRKEDRKKKDSRVYPSQSRTLRDEPSSARDFLLPVLALLVTTI